MRAMKYLTWALCIAAILAALWIYPTTTGMDLREPGFGQFVIDRLIALGMIAAVVERALEVLIEPWRSPGRDVLVAAGDSDRLTVYKTETRLISMAAGIAFGLLVAAIGLRLIEPMAKEGWWEMPSTARSVMRTLDVALVALLIAGGSDAMHKLVSVVINFANTTSDKIKAGAN